MAPGRASATAPSDRNSGNNSYQITITCTAAPLGIELGQGRTQQVSKKNNVYHRITSKVFPPTTILSGLKPPFNAPPPPPLYN